jgi:hypothetical protein
MPVGSFGASGQAPFRRTSSCNDSGMSSPNAGPISQRGTFSFESITKGITYALPFIYLCGFVVLSLFEAEFGINDLSLVRVKTLAAGLLFALFIIYPSLASLRAFQLFGFQKPGSTVIDIGPNSNMRYFYTIKIMELYILSSFIAMGLLFFLTDKPRVWITEIPYQEPGHFSLLTYSAGVMTAAIFFLGIIPSIGGLIRKHFSAKPPRCAVLISLVSVLWLIWTFEMSDRMFFELVGWCYLVGLGSILAGRGIEKGKGLKSTDWELGIVIAFSILVPWFATSFYGNIKSAFGGGSPGQSKLYLKEDNPILRAKIVDVLIVEETEQGYYVVNPTNNSKTAVFVPRSSVSTAEFRGPRK